MSPHRVQPDTRTSLVLIASGIVLGAAGMLLVQDVLSGSEEPDLKRYREVRDFVEAAFVREVDDEVLLDEALEGMLEGLDGYSRYFGPREVAGLERETSGRYRGIGVVFARPVSEGRILFALPGSPAARAGLEVGDRVVEVDGLEVAGMALDGLVQALTGHDRDELRLVVQPRQGTRREVRIEREEMVDPTIRHARIADAGTGAGYLALTSFSEETPAELDRNLEFLAERGLRALVLDVRANAGGVLTSAVEVANRFLAEGLIVSTEGRGQPVRYRADPAEATWSALPLVILVDGDSASASEVLAGALQDHRRAVIVGEPSYGKGMVQGTREFHEPEAVVRVTTSYYYTPSHRNLEKTVPDAWQHGIHPDLLVEVSAGERRSIRRHLVRYTPPESALPRIHAWEQEEGLELLDPLPDDPQLEAALALLRGERPGPHGGGVPD